MSLELRLELLADAAPGSGTAGPDVDRDVVTDERGLPLLPGRRLKGLLREACLEATEALTLAGLAGRLESSLLPAARLFGTASQPGIVQIGDARAAGLGDAGRSLADAERLAASLDWAAQTSSLFANAGIREQFTVVRRQTAIDPATGAALAHALRSTRLLRRGLRFAGPIAIAADDAALARRGQWTLALACAALRRLGSGRQRGPGRVRAQLWDSAAGDLTRAAVDLVGQIGTGGTRA